MKLNQKGIAPWVIVAIIVVAAAVIGGVVLLTMRPAAPPAPQPGEDIGAVTSLSFKVDTTYAGERTTMTVRWRADNKLRVEGTVDGREIRVIVDEGVKKAWVWIPEIGWQDISAIMPWSTIEQMHIDPVEGFRERLSGWTGGEITYTDPTTGATVRIYDIEVNPHLPDALFRPD